MKNSRDEYKIHQTAHKASFRFWVEADIVLIEDMRGDVSVTVDALHVYQYVEKVLGSLDGKKVIWQDLMGEWDGMEMENGEIAFFPIGCRCQVEAIEKVNQMEVFEQRSERSVGK